MALIVEVFQPFSDNFGYLLRDEATGRVASIDAGEAAPISERLKTLGWALTDILVTHHHADHTAGILALKAEYGAKVTGPAAEADKIEGLDATIAGGDTIMLGETAFSVIETPGHTLGHVVYFDAAGLNLFSGDALFSLGCGRMFEGEPKSMWEGLLRLRALPDATRIHCGHEYTRANARFALSIDPDNVALKARAAEVQALLDAGKPTIPARLGDDKAANPFLRADDPDLAARMDLLGAEPFVVFGAIRKAKDTFR